MWPSLRGRGAGEGGAVRGAGCEMRCIDSWTGWTRTGDLAYEAVERMDVMLDIYQDGRMCGGMYG